MARSFFSDEECRAAGFSEPMIRTLKKIADFVDAIDRIATAEEAIVAQEAIVDALAEAQEDANVTLGTLDTRLDAFEVLAPFVEQDVGAAWSSPSATAARTAIPVYAAAVITNPPTQAEVQAISTQLAAVTAAAAGIVTDLKANGALT